MEKAFTSFKIGNLVLPNRLIRAAMYEPWCNNGILTQKYINHHIKTVKGGVGMNTGGFAAVNPEGSISNFQLDLSKKENIPLLEELVDAVHEEGGLISNQLSWCGSEYQFSSDSFHRKSEDEIESMVDLFVDAAVLSKNVGYDAIELHHFFINCFMHESENTRTDKYGGSFENRMRFPIEVLKGIRKKVGADYPVFVKLNVGNNETQEELETAIQAALLFESELASSVIPFRMPYANTGTRLFLLEHAKELQKNLTIPVTYSGGILTAEDVETVMNEGFELVQVGRANLRDINFAKKIKNGEKPKRCAFDNLCHNLLWLDDPKLRCNWEKEEDI